MHIEQECRFTCSTPVRELIMQTYNHLSVILYGMSNEIYRMSDSIFALYEEMYEFIRLNGGGRAAAYSDAQFRGSFPKLPADAVGYNRYFGGTRKRAVFDDGSADSGFLGNRVPL